jgi:hypothetical protein
MVFERSRDQAFLPREASGRLFLNAGLERESQGAPHNQPRLNRPIEKGAKRLDFARNASVRLTLLTSCRLARLLQRFDSRLDLAILAPRDWDGAAHRFAKLRDRRFA